MNDHRVGFRADELNSAYDPVFGDIIGTPVEGQDENDLSFGRVVRLT
jgi:hypothetical protein